jgi:hypothetical protein
VGAAAAEHAELHRRAALVRGTGRETWPGSAEEAAAGTRAGATKGRRRLKNAQWLAETGKV